MKKIYLFLLSFNFITCFGQDANNKIPDNFSTVFRDARFCGEVVLKSYDTVKIGSTWVIDKIHYVRLDYNSNQSTKVYATDLKTINKSIWPKLGDTCLVIVDKKRIDGRDMLSSFAVIKNYKYTFYDPYTNSSAFAPYEMGKKEFNEWYTKNNWQFTSNH